MPLAGGRNAVFDGETQEREESRPHLVVEDAPKMVSVRKDVSLVRKICASRVDQVDARQVVLPRNVLSPQMLLHGHWVIRPRLDGRVVAHNHALLPGGWWTYQPVRPIEAQGNDHASGSVKNSVNAHGCLTHSKGRAVVDAGK
jgi:hypothetical protein